MKQEEQKIIREIPGSMLFERFSELRKKLSQDEEKSRVREDVVRESTYGILEPTGLTHKSGVTRISHKDMFLW